MASSSDEDDTTLLSQESDSQDLPDISFLKKTSSELPECRPVTPVACETLSVPAPWSTGVDSLASLEHLSPLKAAGVGQRMKQDTKLVRRATDLSNEIICKEEMDRKIEAIKQEGGIMNIAKRLEDIISRSEDEEAGLEAGLSTPAGFEAGSSDHSFPPPLFCGPPGTPLFTQAPSLLSEVYPPCLEPSDAPAYPWDHLLTQDSHLFLRDAIATGLLTLCYRNRPCPLVVWTWLFQLMCRSCDNILCTASFRVLSDLVLASWQGQHTPCCPSVMEIQDILTGLGANRDLVHSLACGDPDTDASSDVFSPPLPNLLPHHQLTCLIRFIGTCVHYFPASYCTGDLCTLVLVLVRVSLDPGVHGTPSSLPTCLSLCIGALLRAIPGHEWAESEAQLCSGLEGLSQHHHNQLHIAQVVSTATKRQEQLASLFAKRCIARITGVSLVPEGAEFVVGVLSYYCSMRASQYDHYQMFSVLRLLTLHVPPSKLKWRSPDARHEVIHLLAHLASQLKDRVSMNIESAFVKHYILDIKMELDSKTVVDGPLQQTLQF